MRRRLTIAMLAVVVGTLVLTVAGSLLLVRRTAVSATEDELRTQAGAVAQLLSQRSGVAADERIFALLRQVGSADYLDPVGLSPDGTFTFLPAPLTAGALDVAALAQGSTVTGNVGTLAFVAEPVTLTARQRSALGGIPARDEAVLLVTRRAHDPVNGIPTFVLVAAIVLGIGAVVAAWLARLVSTPVRRAAAATRRMADGDFSATVPVRAGDPPELRELAESVNAMGAGLARSRGLERQFLLSVSHDLRTPLTSIRGYAEALAEGAADDVAGAAGVIGTEARRLERLVQDLLDLARLDARRFSLDVRRIDAGSVVGGAVEAMRPEAGALGLELTVHAPPGGGPWVDADPDRLGQVVANLVENGCKFAAHRVAVSVEEQDRWCRVTVTDDGAGIPVDALAHVFERHFTAERAPGRRVGSGLGLAIVAELARAMGGAVAAHSPAADGRGTTMVLWLPARPAGA